MFSDILTFFKLLLSKKKLIIYCESNSYSKYFTEVINQLLKNKIKFIYICQKNDTNIDELGIKTSFQFNNTKFSSAIISSIDCEKLILTTPDFGDTVKISKKCNEYIYIFHSLVSSHMVYREKAFDCYNTICCVGPHHQKEFSKKNKKINQKLLKLGYPFLDTLIKKKELSKENSYYKKILIAPSWLPDENNYYYDNYFDLIKILIKKDYEVILRPHPEFLKRYTNNVSKLVNEIKSEKKLFIDKSNDNFNSMLQSKYLITDWSGISLEFAFVFKRPVLFLDTKKKILNNNFQKINSVPIEMELRDKIGLIVQKSEMKNIDNFLIELDQNKKKYESNIEDSIKKFTYNYGKSSIEFIEYLKKNN